LAFIGFWGWFGGNLLIIVAVFAVEWPHEKVKKIKVSRICPETGELCTKEMTKYG
jgi:hypothetical protein